MINRVYQLEAPGRISVKFTDLSTVSDNVLVRPTHLAICHADQRYFTGSRGEEILRKKLPMALIHEATGEVVNPGRSSFAVGDKVILIPNIPGGTDALIAENYRPESKFMSSSCDGFMQEYVELPEDRLICSNGIPSEVAAIGEFIAVAAHAISGLEKRSIGRRDSIGIWGDGRLGYTMAYSLQYKYPQANITVIGRDWEKLSYFSFADQTYLSQDVPDGLQVDHAFECTGGEGCSSAIDQIIGHINAEGTIILLGVSENKVPINTRMVLEKGLTLLGRSRSGREDFEKAVELLSDVETQHRLTALISEVVDVRSIDDIYRAFRSDTTSLFKTVMKWDI
jgi:ribitol-5-phosphate 2-dehydrogenase (NADP+)